jgi:hypothetical protein
MRAYGLMHRERVARPGLNVLVQNFASPIIHFEGQRGECTRRRYHDRQRSQVGNPAAGPYRGNRGKLPVETSNIDWGLGAVLAASQPQKQA